MHKVLSSVLFSCNIYISVPVIKQIVHILANMSAIMQQQVQL